MRLLLNVALEFNNAAVTSQVQDPLGVRSFVFK
jgi:hypothetical protein